MRDRGRFAEIASAVAVVLSLVFVGLEVLESARQTELNTQSLQVSTYQDLIAQITNLNAILLGDPDLNRRLAETRDLKLDDLSTDQFQEVAAYTFMLLRQGDLAYYQYELGMLAEERLESAFAVMDSQMCRPRFQEFWSLQSDNFASSYRDYLNGKISEC